MSTDLKRFNSIGSVNGILLFISILSGKEKVHFREIVNRCDHEQQFRVNCVAAKAFFSYLDLISSQGEFLVPTPDFQTLSKCQEDAKIEKLVYITLKKLISEHVFTDDVVSFDVTEGRVCVKRMAFPLSYACVRNFLLSVNAIEIKGKDVFLLQKPFETFFVNENLKQRKTITLAQLIAKQEAQAERGLKAEEFVLALEKKRLPRKAEGIKRISDFDVAAGFDIVSFQDEESNIYNKFIEVKSYIGDLHFYWSENEVDVAKRKAGSYYLYIVDYHRIDEEGYSPVMIRDPYKVIMNTEGRWYVSPSAYKVIEIQMD